VSSRDRRPWYERAFDAFYPLLYAHRDEAEARRCLELLPRLAPLGGGPVLDLGCGQGRHLRLLTEQGLVTVGLDLSWPLLELARRDAPGQPLVHADMRRIPLATGSCSAVLSLFTAFGYFGDVRAHEPLVAEIARVLRPGGHWFLDFLNSERVPADLAAAPGERRRDLEAVRVRESRVLAASPPRVVKTVQLEPRPGREAEASAAGIPGTGLCYEEEVTLFTLAELDGLAGGAGLLRIAAAGDYDGAPLDHRVSDRWLLVYRLPDQPGDRP
jgi:SAM-dependent methyltransferase